MFLLFLLVSFIFKADEEAIERLEEEERRRLQRENEEKKRVADMVLDSIEECVEAGETLLMRHMQNGDITQLAQIFLQLQQLTDAIKEFQRLIPDEADD